MSQRYNERHYVWLRRALVVLVLVKSWAWIGIFPVWKVADEPAHFDNIQYRAERGQAPRPTGAKIEAVMGPGVSAELHRSWEVTQHYWRSDFLPGVRSVPEEGELAELARHDDARLSDGQMPAMSYPALYYELGLVPYRLFARSSIVTRAFALRTLSLGFGILAVLCTFAAARRVVDDPWLAFAAALLVALHPVESQQTAAINNDAALVGIGALLFYLQIRMLAAWPDAESWRVYALLGACAGLSLLAKPQALALMPGCAVVVAVGAWGRWRARATLVRLGAAAAAFAPLAVVAAIQLLASARAWATVNQATRPHLDAPLHRGFVGWLLHFDPRFSRFLFRTFWGQFGWIEFGFAHEWFDWLAHFMLALAFALVLAIGLRAAGLTYRWWTRRGLAFSLGTIVVVCAFMLFAEYRSQALVGVHSVIQGRNFLIALPPLAITIVVAFGALVPARLRAAMAALLVAGAALLHVGALLTIARYHYGN